MILKTAVRVKIGRAVLDPILSLWRKVSCHEAVTHLKAYLGETSSYTKTFHKNDHGSVCENRPLDLTHMFSSSRMSGEAELQRNLCRGEQEWSLGVRLDSAASSHIAVCRQIHTPMPAT